MANTAETLTRTGHTAAACAPADASRRHWHWTLGNGRTLCGKPAGSIFVASACEYLDSDRACKACARSLA